MLFDLICRLGEVIVQVQVRLVSATVASLNFPKGAFTGPQDSTRGISHGEEHLVTPIPTLYNSETETHVSLHTKFFHFLHFSFSSFSLLLSLTFFIKYILFFRFFLSVAQIYKKSNSVMIL